MNSYLLWKFTLPASYKYYVFSSRFGRFEMKNFLRRPTMVADNISRLVAAPPPPAPSHNFSRFYKINFLLKIQHLVILPTTVDSFLVKKPLAKL